MPCVSLSEALILKMFQSGYRNVSMRPVAPQRLGTVFRAVANPARPTPTLHQYRPPTPSPGLPTRRPLPLVTAPRRQWCLTPMRPKRPNISSQVCTGPARKAPRTKSGHTPATTAGSVVTGRPIAPTPGSPSCNGSEVEQCESIECFVPSNCDFLGGSSAASSKGKIKGSLGRNFENWRKITSNGFVLDMVQNGFTLPFVNETPRSFFQKNNKTALREKVFVEEKITELLEEGFVREVGQQPQVVSPLSVRLSSNKKRFILDLRYVNSFLKPPKFKLDDVKVALEFVDPGGFMCVFDIKSGYFHLDVNKEFWTYLGFSWEFKGKIRFFVFTVLPFGLGLGPFLFTKLLRPLVQWWRGKGFKCQIYIDDGFITGPKFETVSKMSEICRKDLENLGFTLNEKCVWQPMQKLKYLGFVLDLDDFSISVPVEKVKATVAAIDKILREKLLTARQLAQVTGKIISFGIVLGTITQLMTRYMYGFINSAEAWDWPRRPLSYYVRSELWFWRTQLLARPCIRKILTYHVPEILVWTDASATGVGSVAVQGKIVSVEGMGLVGPEINTSSTYRELRAVEFGLEIFKEKLGGKVVKFYTDNQATVAIVKKGSKKISCS